MDRTLLFSLTGALRLLPYVARWNEQVLDELAACGQLYLSAAALTGGDAADRDYLIEAKLARRLVRVPPERVGSVREAYRAVHAPGPPTGETGVPASVDLQRGRATPEPN